MALIDDRGRLFGRVNIIDAFVALLLLGLIPLAYAAMLLFRQPEPVMLGITPSTLTPQVTRVQVTGRNLRPFLRVSFNNQQGTTFALIDAQTAEIQVPALSPGTYDVILYDVAREVSRLPNAITVEGAPLPPTSEARMLVTGSFVALDEATAATITAGVELGSVGAPGKIVVVTTEPPTPERRSLLFSDYAVDAALVTGRQVRALLKATCTVADRRCQVGGADIEPGSVLSVFTPAGTPVRFIVSDAATDASGALVRVRATFVLPSDAAALVRPGDRIDRDPLLGDRVATIVSVGAARRANATMSLQFPTGVVGGGDLQVAVNDEAMLMDAVMQLRAEQTSDGYHYRGRRLRAGAPFVFDSPRYVLRGWIRSINEDAGAEHE